MEEYEKYQRGTPQYIYYRALFEKEVLDLESYSTRIRLSKRFGGFRGIPAVKISSLVVFDGENELFGMKSVSVNGFHICKNCVHRDLPNINGLEGDCIAPNNEAKNNFKFPVLLFLPSKMGDKEVGHFCSCFESK